jgi:hypothetical protein
MSRKGGFDCPESGSARTRFSDFLFSIDFYTGARLLACRHSDCAEPQPYSFYINLVVNFRVGDYTSKG